MQYGANLLPAAETDQHITGRGSILGSSAAVVSLCVKDSQGVLGKLNIQPPGQARLAILILEYYLAIIPWRDFSFRVFLCAVRRGKARLSSLKNDVEISIGRGHHCTTENANIAGPAAIC
jgi:hypothetical protein